MITARHRTAAAPGACAGTAAAPGACAGTAAAPGARTGRALGALALTLTAAAADAAADGERTPMFGGAIVGALRPDPRADIVGLALETAWWRGRLGLALEGAAHWNLHDGGARTTVLGASARLRVLERLLPSLLEPRDVELGLELHGIIERTWGDGRFAEDDPTRYGLGLAIRIRGGVDEDFSSLLTESRLFVRVLASRQTAAEVVARATRPPEVEDEPRALTVLIGLGAAFGGGERRYLDRFRLHPFQ